MRKLLITLSLLMANNAYADSCIPKPDCADMGYNSISCDGAYLKCPFDTSKMACLTEKYDIATPLNCAVGMIYYTDGSCSLTYDNSKVVTGIVVKDNELVMSKPIQMQWSGNYSSTDTSVTNITSSSTAKSDMNGKTNTTQIVASLSSSDSTTAAAYCYNYTVGISGTKQKWYLPAAGELYSYVYGNYASLQSIVSALGWSYFTNAYFWSSSEYSNYYAWYVNSVDGYMDYGGKRTTNSVSCFFTLS